MAAQQQVSAASAAVFAGLLGLYLGLTLLVQWRYSVDLQVLNDVVAIYPYPDDLGAALADNSVLLWIVIRLQSLDLGDTDSLLKLIYIGAFAAKTALLLRLFGWLPTLAFTLLFFFSIDLNQARLSLAVCFLLLSWHTWNKGLRKSAIVLLACAVVCHYPGALSLALFYICGRYPKTAVALTAVALITVAIVAFRGDSPLVRYLLYLEVTGEEGGASFFVVTALLAALFWPRLSDIQRLVTVTAVAASVATRDLVNLSGRVSELAAACILLSAPALIRRKREALEAEEFALVIGVLFFAYRFIQWVVLDKVPLPSNL